MQAKERIFSHMSNFKDRALGLRSFLGGTIKFYKGGRRSVDAVGKYHSSKYITSMIKHMEDAEVYILQDVYKVTHSSDQIRFLKGRF